MTRLTAAAAFAAWHVLSWLSRRPGRWLRVAPDRAHHHHRGDEMTTDDRAEAEQWRDLADERLAQHDKPMSAAALMQRAHYELLAAIHDELLLQTGTLTDLVGSVDDLAEVLRQETPQAAQESRSAPEAGTGASEGSQAVTEAHSGSGRVTGRTEPDGKSDPGLESAPRALICTEAEAEAHREVRRLVITTYQIEDDPSVLRGSDGADMTPSALAWLDRFVTDADPDAHPAYTGKPEKPEPDTVTLPRDVVDRAARGLREAAWLATSDGRESRLAGSRRAGRYEESADALDAATTPDSSTSAPLTAQEPSEAPEGTEGADDERLSMACDWSDFRKDYGVSTDPGVSTREHRAFLAGWRAGRHGDQSGVLR